MNEHIKELLFEVVTMEGEDGDLFPSLHTKKQIEEFAELIVKECADIADFCDQVESVEAVSSVLKRHFGVEE
jgi:hypothetical protein